MGKHEKPKEIPADKLAENMPPARKPNMASKLADLRAKYVARRDAQQAAQEKASYEFDRKTWNWFRKTWLGKAWVRFRNNLKKTKSGRRILSGIYLTMAGSGLLLLLAARPLLGLWFDSWGGHVNLTDKQLQAGYYEGCSGSKHCSPDGAAYRDMTASEKASDPNCKPNADECISVIPLRLECAYVTVVIDEYEKKDDWSAANRLFLEEYPEGRKNWVRGKPFTFSIAGLNGKYDHWVIDQVRCNS